MKYVIADDHEAFRKLVRDFLPGIQPQVIECTNGIEALQACAAEKPDWVLMDIEMPVMDGLTALRAVRLSQPKIRVVIVTHHDNEELRRLALTSGAAAFVLKDDLLILRSLLATPSLP